MSVIKHPFPSVIPNGYVPAGTPNGVLNVFNPPSNGYVKLSQDNM